MKEMLLESQEVTHTINSYCWKYGCVHISWNCSEISTLIKRWLMLFQDVDIKWVEYQNMVMYLSQWIKHNVTVMSDRNFPSNPVELKVRCLTILSCF